MTDTLERTLRRHFDEQTSHLPTSGPGLPDPFDARLTAIESPNRRVPVILLVAASIAALTLAGLAFVARDADGELGVAEPEVAELTPDDPDPDPDPADAIEPAATLPSSGDFSTTPITVAASTATDWYRFAPDLDVAWYLDPAGTEPSMFCWRTPAEPAGVCSIDTAGAMVVPLVVPGAPGQTLVLAGGDPSDPTLEVTLDDGTTISAPQDFDDIIDWGVARFELPADRAITLVSGVEVRDPAPFDDSRSSPGAADEEALRALVGRSIGDFTDLAADLGFTTRVVREDGVDLPIRMDLRDDRANVAVDNGFVSELVSIG